MSTIQLKTLKLEIRIPYSDTPYFLQLHSSSTVSHLKSKLFRKTSSLQGRKLDSYALAVKTKHEETYDPLNEDKKVVKSHPLIEDEYHKNKLVTLYLIRSVDLNGDLSPKSVIYRGTSETQLRLGPLMSPARFSLIVPPANPFPLPPEAALPLVQSFHSAMPAVLPSSPPSHTFLRSKSEPSIRRSMSNSLTSLPLYQISSPPTDFTSLLSNSTTSQLEYGMGSETGSEPLSSHCDSDTESVEDIEEDKDQPASSTSPTSPTLPPPSTDQSSAIRPRAFTVESNFNSTSKTPGKGTKNEKTDKMDVSKADKKRDKSKSKHSWWRRDDKGDKEKDKEGERDRETEKTKDNKKDNAAGNDGGKRLSIKIPHLHPHVALSHISAPGHLHSSASSSSPMTGHAGYSATVASNDNSSTSLKNSSSASSSPSSLDGAESSTSPYSSPPGQSLSPQPVAPTSPPLTPTPARSHVKVKFQIQSLTASLPPPTPPKFAANSEDDLSNKRSNPGLSVEEDPSGRLLIVAGNVDELIYCLADRDIPDRAYCDVFMSTLSYFTTMEYVLKKLIDRYEYTCEDPSYMQKWRPIIQTRVLKVLRGTLESHEYLFSKNPSLLGDLRRFLESIRYSHPNKMAVREFDSLLRLTLQGPANPPSTAAANQPSSLHRTSSQGSHTIVIPVVSAKASAGASHPTLTRSSSSTFISLTSSSSSSSSLGSSNSNSPNGSPESLTLILSSVATDSCLHDSDLSSKISDSSSATGREPSDVTSSSSDLATHGKTGSIQNFGPSHSQSNLMSPTNSSPPFRHIRRDSIIGLADPTPSGASKKNKSSKLILKVRPIDMAKQFTLLEKEMFCKITPTDLMMAAWKKKDKAQAAPNVLRIIEWFNKIAAWAQTAIVVTGNLRDRIAVLSRIIQIAEHCIELHNYSTGMELVSGLRCSSVSRLTRTWKGLGKKEMAAWESMAEIFDAQGNFATYRRLIHLAHGEPALPYLGVVLQDLLMVEELPSLLPNSDMVNFRKMRRFASLLREEILDRQAAAHRYAFDPNPHIQEYFSLFSPLSDADLYKCSRICEPAALA